MKNLCLASKNLLFCLFDPCFWVGTAVLWRFCYGVIKTKSQRRVWRKGNYRNLHRRKNPRGAWYHRASAIAYGGYRAIRKINLILDFTNVKFLSSAVLGLLIRVSKKIYEQDGQLRLCDISPRIYEIFKITRLTKIFDILPDRAAATASLTKEQ